MNDFQEKRSLRTFFASWPVLAMLFLLVVGVGISTFRAVLRSKQVKEENRTMEERLRLLEEERNSLSSDLQSLSQGQGLTRQAREKLHYRKPGEEVAIIVDEPEPDVQEEQANPAGLFERLQQFFNLR